MNTATITPVQHRIAALDILRGFALFGVLLVNMLDFSSSALRVDTLGTRGGELDQLMDIAIAFFAITKFYLRCLLILLVIGFAHAVLLWDGDILRLYGVAGVLLLAGVRHGRLQPCSI